MCQARLYPVMRDSELMSTQTHYSQIDAYTTKDGSEIRELMHPTQHGNSNQSLAEALVFSGQKTALHVHHKSEELYHITQGQGLMTLGDKTFTVSKGDTICIQPGTAHCIENSGSGTLHILCCCSPAYAHEDTQLLEDPYAHRD